MGLKDIYIYIYTVELDFEGNTQALRGDERIGSIVLHSTISLEDLFWESRAAAGSRFLVSIDLRIRVPDASCPTGVPV